MGLDDDKKDPEVKENSAEERAAAIVEKVRKRIEGKKKVIIDIPPINGLLWRETEDLSSVERFAVFSNSHSSIKISYLCS